MQTILIPQPGPGDVLIQVPISTGHPGGALAVAIAAGAGIWMARADSVRRDLR